MTAHTEQDGQARVNHCCSPDRNYPPSRRGESPFPSQPGRHILPFADLLDTYVCFVCLDAALNVAMDNGPPQKHVSKVRSGTFNLRDMTEGLHSFSAFSKSAFPSDGAICTSNTRLHFRLSTRWKYIRLSQKKRMKRLSGFKNS